MTRRQLILVALALAIATWELRGVIAAVIARASKLRPPGWLANNWQRLAAWGLVGFCLVAAFGLPSLPSLPVIEWPSVTPAGATHFIVLHEATKDDARFGELAQELQDADSPAGKAIAAAGWRVQALDDNATTASDQPHPTLKALGLFDTINDSRRELVAYRPPATLVAKEPLPPDATADTVLAMIQARGKR